MTTTGEYSVDLRTIGDRRTASGFTSLGQAYEWVEANKPGDTCYTVFYTMNGEIVDENHFCVGTKEVLDFIAGRPR